MSDGAELSVESALALGAATLGEAGARRLHDGPAPMWSGAAVAGPARPVSCTPGDNLGIHAAVATAAPGDVLVVTVGGSLAFGYWGEVLAVAAQHRGIAGLVIDGCVRDVDALERRGFPVFARGTALPGATKSGAGTIDEPVTIGGIEIVVGDWVVADRDGVVILPSSQRAAILAAGRARDASEQLMFAALESDATTVELLGLDVSPIRRARPQ
jgi:4-hydroxy-4-methyl-2-oxoglutarate aldolase